MFYYLRYSSHLAQLLNLLQKMSVKVDGAKGPGPALAVRMPVPVPGPWCCGLCLWFSGRCQQRSDFLVKYMMAQRMMKSRAVPAKRA